MNEWLAASHSILINHLCPKVCSYSTSPSIGDNLGILLAQAFSSSSEDKTELEVEEGIFSYILIVEFFFRERRKEKEREEH